MIITHYWGHHCFIMMVASIILSWMSTAYYMNYQKEVFTYFFFFKGIVVKYLVKQGQNLKQLCDTHLVVVAMKHHPILFIIWNMNPCFPKFLLGALCFPLKPDLDILVRHVSAKKNNYVYVYIHTVYTHTQTHMRKISIVMT